MSTAHYATSRWDSFGDSHTTPPLIQIHRRSAVQVRIASEDVKSRLEADGQPFDEQAELVARPIGIGAVKYADLSLNRESNYRFSYAKMLALNGNTAPYMLYAYARIKGIERKAKDALEGEGVDVADAELVLEHETEVRRGCLIA